MISVDSSPSISVVIPNRNDTVYIETCLKSVLDQSTPADQIIFVDDQSSDNSVAVAQKLLKTYATAQIIINPVCLGTMGALNEGLKRATSDYVLFLASNDFVLDGLFNRAKQSICEIGFPGVWSAMVWVADEEGNPIYLYPSSVVRFKGDYISPKECVQLAMKTASWFTGTTLMFNREALNAIGGFDSHYQGLADLLAALTISSTYGAIFLPEPLGVMRNHGGGYLSRTLTDLENLERILSIIETKGPLLSPQLFNSKFCSRIKKRFRFSALRELQKVSTAKWPQSWSGVQYRILKKTSQLIEKNRLLKMVCAMFLLRPFDILPMIWYRLIGTLWVMVLIKKKNISIPKGDNTHCVSDR